MAFIRLFRVKLPMQQQTTDWLNKEGLEKSKQFFHKMAPGVSKLFPKGLDDNTHFNEKGARIVAGFFVEGLKQQKISALTDALKENIKPYISKVLNCAYAENLRVLERMKKDKNV